MEASPLCREVCRAAPSDKQPPPQSSGSQEARACWAAPTVNNGSQVTMPISAVFILRAPFSLTHDGIGQPNAPCAL